MTTRMGPQTQTPGQVRPGTIALPADLAAVALCDGKTAAATGHVSLSTWQAQVAAGDAPQPAIQQPRFTRWRIADVAAYWSARAAAGIDAKAAERLRSQAHKASAAARAKRQAEGAQ